LSESLTRVYRKGNLEAEGFPISELSEYLDEADTVVWADLCRPTKEQLGELALELNLHELAVEDAVGRQQRPKVDRYESHLFLTAYAVGVDIEHGELEEIEVDAFITDRYLITVRKNEGFAIEPVIARWDRSPDLAVYGTGFLLYGFLDVMVDGYFDAIEAFDNYYEQVSEGLFADQPLDPSEQRVWFDMRRAMVRFHRLVVPTREAVSSLMRREHSVIAQGIYPY
jgi:magnesium transporter